MLYDGRLRACSSWCGVEVATGVVAGAWCVTVSRPNCCRLQLVGPLFIAVAAGWTFFEPASRNRAPRCRPELGIDGSALCASSIRLWCSGFRLDGDGADIPPVRPHLL